jgi:hypothetical protein
MRTVFLKKFFIAGMISSLFLLSNVTVLEENKLETDSRIENLSLDEKVKILEQLKEIEQFFEKILEDEAMRASRPDAPTYGDQTYPVPPSSSLNSVLLEQIRCIVCWIKKYIGSVEDCTLLTFPDDVLGRLCYIRLLLNSMDSKLDQILSSTSACITSTCDLCVVEAKIDKVEELLNSMDSKIDQILSSTCITSTCDLCVVEAKIDKIEEKIGEPWDIIDFDLLPSNTQETNDATYSVIEWLKAIYYHLYNEV